MSTNTEMKKFMRSFGSIVKEGAAEYKLYQKEKAKRKAKGLKEYQKLLKQQQKEKAMADKKAAKEAERQANKAAKDAERQAKKAAKKAAKEAEKQAKKAAKEAEKEANKAAKKQKTVVSDTPEVTIKITKEKIDIDNIENVLKEVKSKSVKGKTNKKVSKVKVVAE